jgi:hypothetical protein
MYYSTKKHISRRTVLRGLGVTMALPFLDSMVPAHTALAQTAANPPLRLGFCFVPHGALIASWTPVAEGSHWELSRNLEPLKNVKDQVVVLTNLNLRCGFGHGGTPPAFLSGVACRQTEGEDVRAATTLDQILARKTGRQTPLPSLELGTEETSGWLEARDLGYSCTYIDTISWKSATEPLPVEINPRAVFDRLFGGGSSAVERPARVKRECSVLDAVGSAVKSLQSGLGASDRNRVAGYLDDVRDIERRIQLAETQNANSNIEAPGAATGIPSDHVEHTRLMFDLMALAYQADITRIQAFMMAREVSYRAFPHIGAPDGFHSLSHHQFDAVRMEQLIDVNTYHVAQMARFLERMKNTPDGDGSLLDHSLMLYGSGMGLANSHQNDALPVFIAGGANGRLQGNRHLKYPGDTPLSNLLLSISDKAGVHLDSLGDSTDRLEGI